MKQSPDSMKKQELMNDPQEQRQSLTGSIPSSDKTKDEKGMAQKNHLRNRDCYKYFRTGTCGRSRCIFNHHNQLPEELQDKATMPVCKFFRRGQCKKGSRCDLRHAMNSDGAEPMRPSTSQSATESRQGLEATGSKRPRSPMNPSVNAQENLQERRQKKIKRRRRVTQVNLQQQRLMREMPENHNVEAHDQGSMEEQRKIEIERKRTEARLKLEQMKPTALFDERSRAREGMEEFGFKDAEGF